MNAPGSTLLRPILERERPHLHNLGRLLRNMRQGCGLTTSELGLHAEISRQQVWRIERGYSRTCRSTLRRLAAALVVANPSLSFGRLVQDLVDAAGPALAEESVHAERKARRRAVRSDRAWEQERLNWLATTLDYIERNQRWPDGQLHTEWELEEIDRRASAVLRSELKRIDNDRRIVEELVRA